MSPAGVGVRVGGVVVAAAGVHLLKHGPVLIFILINLLSKLQKLAHLSKAAGDTADMTVANS